MDAATLQPPLSAYPEDSERKPSCGKNSEQRTWSCMWPERKDGHRHESPPGSPGSSDGKESACNAGDLSSTPGREDPLKKEMDTVSSILAWRIPWTEKQSIVHGVAKSQTQLNN